MKLIVALWSSLALGAEIASVNPLPHECAALVEAASARAQISKVRVFEDLRALELSDLSRHFFEDEWRMLSWKIAESGLARKRVFYAAEGPGVPALVEDARRLAPTLWALEHSVEARLAATPRSRGLWSWLAGPRRRGSRPEFAPEANPALVRIYSLRPFLADEIENPDEAFAETRYWDAHDGVRHFVFIFRAAKEDSALIVAYWREPETSERERPR